MRCKYVAVIVSALIILSVLSFTVFAGDEDSPRDMDSAKVWMELGVPEERIYYLPKEDNWWGLPAGGPCGPNTEMFIDTGRPRCSPQCRPGCGCGKYFEIWNDVFMQYNKQEDGSFKAMERQCVDTGMGVERTSAILQGKQSVYETEAFVPLIRYPPSFFTALVLIPEASEP